eukprot:4792290-Pyramimonas_sp.AAC.1
MRSAWREPRASLRGDHQRNYTRRGGCTPEIPPAHSMENLRGRLGQPAARGVHARVYSRGRRPQAHAVYSCPSELSRGDFAGIGTGSTDYCCTDDEHQVA